MRYSMYYKTSDVEPPQKELASWMYLNPEESKKDLRIKPEVRGYLLKVIKKILSLLPIQDIPLKDVQIVGSSIGYNYNEESDIDLHFIIDIDEFAKEHNLSKEEAKDMLGYMFRYLNCKDIFEIEGHPIELYWQDDDEENFTPAIYSVLRDKFIKLPEDPVFDEKDLQKAKKTAKKMSNLLDELIDFGDVKGVEDWLDKVKLARKIGLENKGIFSFGNLLFKFLRSWGDLEKARLFISKTV